MRLSILIILLSFSPCVAQKYSCYGINGHKLGAMVIEAGDSVQFLTLDGRALWHIIGTRDEKEAHIIVTKEDYIIIIEQETIIITGKGLYIELQVYEKHDV